ncbi:hypothetical protein BpHYR1_024815 [Brachionus plicatilis]|uniref:Uncharacterized protein n=1 Tax=Brachionus plicatilis TaxID=10195 RepID=A0A3M7PP45_BRAPC|nr:hypothetical protein BpHYR1_024815 [Brachionus plicatilis]
MIVCKVNKFDYVSIDSNLTARGKLSKTEIVDANKQMIILFPMLNMEISILRIPNYPPDTFNFLYIIANEFNLLKFKSLKKITNFFNKKSKQLNLALIVSVFLFFIIGSYIELLPSHGILAFLALDFLDQIENLMTNFLNFLAIFFGDFKKQLTRSRNSCLCLPEKSLIVYKNMKDFSTN